MKSIIMAKVESKEFRRKSSLKLFVFRFWFVLIEKSSKSQYENEVV